MTSGWEPEQSTEQADYDFGGNDETVLKAKHSRKHRGGKRSSGRCQVRAVHVKGRGIRYMLICPGKRAKFISEARAKSMRRR